MSYNLCKYSHRRTHLSMRGFASVLMAFKTKNNLQLSLMVVARDGITHRLCPQGNKHHLFSMGMAFCFNQEQNMWLRVLFFPKSIFLTKTWRHRTNFITGSCGKNERFCFQSSPHTKRSSQRYLTIIVQNFYLWINSPIPCPHISDKQKMPDIPAKWWLSDFYHQWISCCTTTLFFRGFACISRVS